MTCMTCFCMSYIDNHMVYLLGEDGGLAVVVADASSMVDLSLRS